MGVYKLRHPTQPVLDLFQYRRPNRMTHGFRLSVRFAHSDRNDRVDREGAVLTRLLPLVALPVSQPVDWKPQDFAECACG